MRILMIEDEEDVAMLLRERIEREIPGTEFDWERCSSEAERKISANTYDVMLIDLALPVNEGDADRSIENGKALEAVAFREQPGAIRLFVSAFDANYVKEILSTGEAGDFLFAGDRYALVEHFEKELADIQRLIARLTQHANRLEALDRVVLENAGDMTIDQRRGLALTVRVASGVSGRVVRTRGRSGSVTAVIECTGASGAAVGNAFIKLGSQDQIEVERAGYENVRFQLDGQHVPQLAELIRVGIGRNEGLVFTRAPDSLTFFELFKGDADKAAATVGYLPRVFAPWQEGSRAIHARIGDLRRSVVTDAELEAHSAELDELGIGAVEQLEIETLEYCQHGDLHGANLLVTTTGAPFLVDFARTGRWFGGIDPVVLELSLIFHPDGPGPGSIAPDDCLRWNDAEFGDGHLIGGVLAACRVWTESLGISGRSRAAVVMICAMRQLKYPDRWPMHALSIVRSCIRVIEGKTIGA